jgi:hypothetical protein
MRGKFTGTREIRRQSDESGKTPIENLRMKLFYSALHHVQSAFALARCCVFSTGAASDIFPNRGFQAIEQSANRRKTPRQA